MKRLVKSLSAFALVFALVPASAAAHYPNTPQGVYHDCLANNYHLTQYYPVALLNRTLAQLRNSGAQYSACADVIKLAEDAELAPPTASSASSGDANGGKGGKHPGAGNVDLNGHIVSAGTVGIRGSSFLASLPTPILLILVVLLATALAIAARFTRQVVIARRTG